MLRAAAVVLATLLAGVACQNSTTSVALLTMKMVTPSHDAQTLVVPSAPQHVAFGTSQRFAVNPASGYHVTRLVGGTCTAGTWSQNIYTTGTVNADCTVIFSSVIGDYDVTVTGAHVTTSPPVGDLMVSSGTPQALTVTADAGYALSSTVGGTCPAGIWSGDVYATGPINANCSLSFAATPVYFTVTPADGNVSTTPVGPQPVLWGSAQSFSVVANAGFTLSPNVAGTCPAGDWNGTTYTTGAVDANCTVVFDAYVPVKAVTTYVENVAVTPVAAWVPVGSTGQFTVTAHAGYALPNTVGGSCAAGTWTGSTYTTGVVTADCNITLHGVAYLPYAVPPNLSLSNVYSSGGNTLFNFNWVAPLDMGTQASDQNYTLCASYPNPAYGSFTDVEDVLNGNICVNIIGATQASIVVPQGHTYLFNVVVSNVSGATAAYQARGEFADDTQLHYIPFDTGESTDLTGNLDLVTASYPPTMANGGLQDVDRFNNETSSWSFSAAGPDCLMTTQDLEPVLTGTNPRTLAFWLRPGVNAGSTVAVSMGGNGAPMANGDHFGLYNTAPSGSGSWQHWFFGDDYALSAPYIDNSAWQFWVLTYSNGAVASAYLNGVRVGQNSTWTSTPVTASSVLWVGCGVDGMNGTTGSLTKFFTGQIDDVRTFSRVLCDGTSTNGCVGTVNEVANLYNVSRP